MLEEGVRRQSPSPNPSTPVSLSPATTTQSPAGLQQILITRFAYGILLVGSKLGKYRDIFDARRL